MLKVLIVYTSIHHKNTQAIARAMASSLNADLRETQAEGPDDILNYDLIGFGSGIYFGGHHRLLFELIRNIRLRKKKGAFIFSTSGVPGKWWHRALRRQLIRKDFDILGEFNCPGWDTVGPLKLFGGLNKGRPNEQDLKNAKSFAASLIS